MSAGLHTPEQHYAKAAEKNAARAIKRAEAAERRALKPPRAKKVKEPEVLPVEAPLSPEAFQPRPGYTLYEEMRAFFRTLRVPEGPLMGHAWQLLPYQDEVIRALCEPEVRRVIVSLPRKSGKTAFAAALLLAAICGPLARYNSSLFSAARSRDQASLVYALAVKIIAVTSWMQNEVRTTHSRKLLHGVRFNTEFRALAADARTQHGLSPVFVIHDELGQVSGETDDLYDALETSFGAQVSPKSLIISTQAAEDTDLLSTLIDDAIASADPRTRVFLYAAERNDDPWSEATWKRCHPAYGLFRNPLEFREAADRAKRLPSAELSFRRYYLNQRVTGDTGLVTPSVWRANNGDVDPTIFFDGRPVYGGLDLSAKQDLTAAAFVTEDDDGAVHVMLRAWTPERTLLERAARDRAPYVTWVQQGHLTATPGNSISLDHVVADIATLTSGMNLVSIGYDRWNVQAFKSSADKMEVELPMNAVGQGFKDMSPRVQATIELLLNERLRHGGNPVLTSAASTATTVRDPSGNVKVDKSRQSGRIDPVVAMVMAIGEMSHTNAAASAMPFLI